jgi:hypothetical protein
MRQGSGSDAEIGPEHLELGVGDDVALVQLRQFPECLGGVCGGPG